LEKVRATVSNIPTFDELDGAHMRLPDGSIAPPMREAPQAILEDVKVIGLTETIFDPV
jgi:hypothetical protein